MFAWYEIEAGQQGPMQAKGHGRRERLRATVADLVQSVGKARGFVVAWAVGSALAAAAASQLLTPEYQATALIQVDGRDADIVLREVEAEVGLPDRVLASAAMNLGLSAGVEAMGRLRARIVLTAKWQARSIAATASSAEAEAAARLANAVADAYRSWRVEEAGEMADRTTADLALRIEELSRRVAESEKALSDVPSDEPTSIGSRRLAEAEIASGRSLVESFRQRLQELRKEERGRVLTLRILADAEAPTSPFWPPVSGMAAVGAILGAMFGVGYVFVRTRREDRIRSPEELESATGLPCLATVPALQTGFFTRAQPPIEAISGARSPYGAAMGSLDAGLSLSGGPASGRVIVLTGPKSEEGFDILAASIARVAAKSGRHGRVALIEAGTNFTERGRATVEDYVEGRMTLDDLLGKDPATGLGVIRARSVASAIVKPGFDRLLRALAERFDLVIVAAPPVLVPADARRTGEIADMALVVVEWARTSRRLALDCTRLLSETGLKLGAVLAGADLREVLSRAAAPLPAPAAAPRRYYGD